MFSIRLKRLREEAGFSSQSAFAKKIGVAQSTVGNWEAGTREPNFDTLIMLADFFGCTTDYLLGRTDVRTGHVIEKEKMPSELESMGVTSVTKIGANELTSQEIEVLKKFAAQLTQQD